MSAIDEAMKANEEHYRSFTRGMLSHIPERKLAVVTCMDVRLDVQAMLGLNVGEAHIIRNAGGVVTEDALRSLLISHHLMGTQEFMVIAHTECGMTGFRDEEIRARIIRDTGTEAVTPETFHAFRDVEDHVRDQVQKLRSHPWVPKSVAIRGFVYDVRTGRLSEARIGP